MAVYSLAVRCVAEFVGTFVLVCTIGCNVITGSPAKMSGFSIAMSLMVMVYALGQVSGGHLNPAVSFAVAMSGKGAAKPFTWSDAGVYMLTQLFAGAVAGVYVTFFLALPIMPLNPVGEHTYFQAGYAEFLYTFVLCFVFLNVAYSKKDAGNQYYGLAIGFTVVAGAYGAGSVSMGCFNPAVALGIGVTNFAESMRTICIFWCWQLLGALLASIIYKTCRPEEAEEGAAAAVSYSLYSRLVSEFWGTFVLVLTVGLNIQVGHPTAGASALSIGAALISMIFALGSVSGAHFNPAVTLACVSSGRNICSVSDGVAYVLAQCVGGIAASVSCYMITHRWDLKVCPPGKYSLVQATVAEMVFTFVLAFVVLNVATVKKTKGLTQFFGFAIGSCFMVGGFGIGGVSGGALNPAISLGLTVHHLISGGGLVNFACYVLAELVGGTLAAVAFKTIRPCEYEEKLMD